MSKWKPKTFQFDNRKDIHCGNCGKYLGHDSRLIDKKVIFKTCKDCSAVNPIFPPRKADIDGKPVILFSDSAPGRDPVECTYTADLTKN